MAILTRDSAPHRSQPHVVLEVQRVEEAHHQTFDQFDYQGLHVKMLLQQAALAAAHIAFSLGMMDRSVPRTKVVGACSYNVRR